MGHLFSWFNKDRYVRQLNPRLIAAATPKILWIELTSTCPFNCVFCSRKTMRGKGRHMDFSLYKKLLDSLYQPEILRLNYAGESIHYPELIKAIQLAVQTGARVELVSAFASINPDQLESLVSSGLDQLAISIHGFDHDIYKSIYRYQNVDNLKKKIDLLLKTKEKCGTNKPELSFTLVAMRRNLTQIEKIANYASQIGVRELVVQPVVIRDNLPESFNLETSNQHLNPGFKKDLIDTVNQARYKYSQVNIRFACMENEQETICDHTPRKHSDFLPKKALIYSCDQNPWETAHILSNGDVVVCEVMDRKPLGNITDSNIKNIWNSEVYQSLRKDYMSGRIIQCNACPYTIAYMPTDIKPVIDAKNGFTHQLQRGWYLSDSQDIIWSKKECVALLRKYKNSTQLHIHGILPALKNNPANELVIFIDGQLVEQVRNNTNQFYGFDLQFPIKAKENIVTIKFESRFGYRPNLEEGSEDVRELGFALIKMELL